jgi:riboflavin synthase
MEMFTGMVEEIGTIRAVRRGAHSSVLSIGAALVLSGLKVGDSVAVNGVCLTATGKDEGGFTADVMHETLNRSSLDSLHAGSRVNLERAMAADGRFGGHIVSGHIDGTGRIAAVRRDDNALWYTVEAAPSLLRYIVEKGSITIDGISLTVAAVTDTGFSVSVIPHTAAVTILGQKGPGEVVNLETDILGKYVEKLLRPAENPSQPGGISLEFLAENGF